MLLSRQEQTASFFLRKYSEMMLANLTAAGDAVKDAAKVGLQIKKPIEVKQNKN